MVKIFRHYVSAAKLWLAFTDILFVALSFVLIIGWRQYQLLFPELFQVFQLSILGQEEWLFVGMASGLMIALLVGLE